MDFKVVVLPVPGLRSCAWLDLSAKIVGHLLFVLDFFGANRRKNWIRQGVKEKSSHDTVLEVICSTNKSFLVKVSSIASKKFRL